MAVRTFQLNENKPEIVKLLKDGLTREEIVKRFPISERTVRRYEKEIGEEKANGGKSANLSTSKVAKGAQEMAVVTSKAPAPIIFRISDQNIDIKPGDLYDAFRYCEDIKRMDPSIDDDFSTMVKTACKHVWEVFSEREVRRLGVNVELVEEVG
ncbi:MAG: helix-turn-helix domain-containing protein [Dehalococcoidales bacterium]|nr:helix-turn-helix domain-containing protein [Dehalococcoidales bacterium]